MAPNKAAAALEYWQLQHRENRWRYVETVKERQARVEAIRRLHTPPPPAPPRKSLQEEIDESYLREGKTRPPRRRK